MEWPSIDPEIAKRRDCLIEIRRRLHKNAELSFEESYTSSFVEQHLRGIEGVTDITPGWARAPAEFKGAIPQRYQRPEKGMGITAMIRGEAGSGPCIALRADMDALPIHEESEREYCSQNSGVMHACGHDGHTAMLLVAAEVIASMRSQLQGSVKFIFQPAEEFGCGAKYMVAEGTLKGVDQVFGIHLFTPLRTGTIGVKEGPLMANPDKFSIAIEGKGGHGAMPHLSIDAMACASHVQVALQTVVSRNVDPLEPAVVTVGKMENEEGSPICGCGMQFNVICPRVVMHGTTRSFSDGTRAKIRSSVERVAKGVSEAMGASASTSWDDLFYGPPAVVNHGKEAALMHEAASKVVGEEGVLSGRDIMTMGGEDFSFFLKEVPGCFVFVGATAPGADPTPHHHPSFDLDEESLVIGASLWVRLIELLLSHSNQPHKRRRVNGVCTT